MSPVSCYFHCHHCTGKICPDGAAGAKVTEVKQTLLVGVCECERPVYFEHERYTYNRQTEVNVCTLILCRSTALKEKKKKIKVILRNAVTNLHCGCRLHNQLLSCSYHFLQRKC